MSNQETVRKGLSVKDLVTTGIFTALLFVFTMMGGVFFATNPVLTFYMPAGSALLCGPIYLLMVAKVQKRWSLTIMGVLIGIVWFVTGMHWAFALGYMLMGIIADFVAGAGQYKSKKFNIISYILFSLSRSFFADSSIHACLFRSLLLRFVSVPRTFLIFFLHSGQYFDIAEQGTYSTPHTVQFLGFNAVHRFVGVICNSPTKPMNL